MRGGVADRIALGHTRDDQAETVLFRLLRGSGLRGLAGIHPVTTAGYIRPLIDATRASLPPQLARDWNPRIAESLAHLAHLAHDEELWWQTHLNQIAPAILHS